MTPETSAPTPEMTGPVGLWGPDLTPTRSAVRPRRPWGLGDVWLTFGALILAQIALIPVLLWAALRRQNAPEVTPDVIIAAVDAIPDVVTTGPFAVTALVLQWAAFVGVPLWASRRKGLRSLAADFGLRFTRVDLGLGVAIAVVMHLLMGAMGWLLARTGLDLSGADNTSLVTDHQGIWLAVMVAGAAIGAPFTEELLFRGLVLRAMLRSFVQVDHAEDPAFDAAVAERRHRKNRTAPSSTRTKVGIGASLVLSSLLFGLLHMPVSDGSAQVSLAAQIILPLQTGLLGFVFAVMTLRTRRLGSAIVAHVLFNSISVGLALLLAA